MKARLRKLSPQARAGYKRSVEAQKRKYKEFLEEQERKEKLDEARADIIIDNIKVSIRMAVDTAKTPFTRLGMEISANILLSIIDESVDTWGKTDTAKNLKKWAPDFKDRIDRMVQAVIDTKGAGRYNTNTHAFKRDTSGKVGRDKYKKDIEELAKRLGVRTGRLLEALLNSED